MIRIIISIPEDEKAWLDEMAKKRHVSMAKIIRAALKEYRFKNHIQTTTIDHLLSQTKGLWKKQDGLAYQRKLRDEWSK